jgi:outer membrane protein insertion porin family
LQVTANSELRGVEATGANALPQVEIQNAFADQYGKILNFGRFREGLKKLNSWYEDRGIFGQVWRNNQMQVADLLQARLQPVVSAGILTAPLRVASSTEP